MQKTRHWLMTIAVLLCSVGVSASTYSDWTSTNKGQSSTTSSNTYTITANVGDVLTFDWLVSSESNYDKLIITIGGTEILNKSGELSGSYQHTFTSSGTFKMVVKYTKDESVNKGSDYAKVYNVTLDTGSVGGNGNIVASGTCGANLTWTLSDNGILTIEGTGEMTSSPWCDDYESRIKKVIVNEGVTSIGDRAFEYCTNLSFIAIPQSVISIGRSAFYCCYNLISVTIPESVTSIEYMAFYGCSNLTSITIPENSQLINIGGSVFDGTAWYDNQSNGLTYIGKVLYQYKGTMIWNESLTIKEGTKAIADRAFYNCSKLIHISIPQSVTSIGDETFSGCTSLDYLYLPQNLMSIGSSAFAGCTSLTSITIPQSVTSIGMGAFQNCSSLTSITIPENSQLTIIEAYAFVRTAWYDKQPDGLIYVGKVLYKYKGTMPKNTSINVQEGTKGISGSAFEFCSGLTSITIPASVTYIGDVVFSCCSSLTDITVAEGNTVYDSRGGCDAIIETNSNTLIAGCSATIIPEGVTAIGDWAFEYCYNLTSIIIPEGVTTIGVRAFGNCSSLTSVTIPKSMTSIGGLAFVDCSNLTAVYISDIEAWCNINFSYNPLYYAKNLYLNGELATELTIPEGVTSIGMRAFQNCSSLTSITIPESVTSIGGGAFSDCSNLTAITCKATAPPIVWYFTFENVDKSIPVYVPAGSVAAYQSAAYWNEFTCIQPSEETITINQYGSGTYCSEYALDFSEVEGLKAYAATGYNHGTGVVTLTRVMTSQPGMGLFLKGEPGEYTVPVLESTDDNSLNMLVGTLEQTELNSVSSDGLYANYKYTVAEGETVPLFHPFADGSTLSAGKAYLQIPVAWLPQGEARAISYRFDEGTTSIDKGQWTNDNDLPAEIYDLMGRRVAVPQKGSLYIINNEKVIY